MYFEGEDVLRTLQGSWVYCYIHTVGNVSGKYLLYCSLQAGITTTLLQTTCLNFNGRGCLPYIAVDASSLWIFLQGKIAELCLCKYQHWLALVMIILANSPVSVQINPSGSGRSILLRKARRLQDRQIQLSLDPVPFGTFRGIEFSPWTVPDSERALNSSQAQTWTIDLSLSTMNCRHF